MVLNQLSDEFSDAELAAALEHLHGDASVRVETSTGAVEADRAIITVPLGVLKASAIGRIPSTVAKLVIRIGRRRAAAAS